MKLLSWLDDRTGLVTTWRAFRDRKVPAGLDWGHALGAVALMLFAMVAVTGLILAVYYAPTPDHAHASVRYIESTVRGGRLIRAIHYWGTTLLIITLVLYFIRIFARAAYRAPREVNWIAGLKFFGVILGFGITGCLLPWDQNAYWGTSVRLHIAKSVPLVGPFAAKVLGGGETLGALTLTRFYALHALLLPFLALILIAMHFVLVKRHGTATPPGAPTGTLEPAHPRHTSREAIAATLVFVVLLVLAYLKPAPLRAIADPTDASYLPRPEWYFLGLFQSLKFFPGSLEVIGTVILPGLGVTLLVLLPWLDKSGDRRRIVFGGAAMFLGVVILSILGATDKGGTPTPAFAKDGRTPFQAIAGPMIAARRDCASCHREDGFGSGPPLVGEPHTRSATWIRAHLSDPEYVAPGAREAENKLPSPDSNILMGYLSLIETGPAPVASPADTHGVALIVRESCLGCHKHDGVGGTSGPNLDGVGARRTAKWIEDYLPDPTAIDPAAEMRAYPDLTEEERNAIAQYLVKSRVK